MQAYQQSDYMGLCLIKEQQHTTPDQTITHRPDGVQPGKFFALL